MKKVVFTGGFWEYFGMNIALSLLSVFTLGIGFIYQIFWNMKYFVSHLEIEA